MWARNPTKIYKWIRGVAAAAVWDVAILHENGKLWQPGLATFPAKTTSQSSRTTGDLVNVIAHCPLGKARGVDRWSTGELCLLPDVAIEDLANFLKTVERRPIALATGVPAFVRAM
eukprot:1169707-Amphidinium_carterae.1